MSCGFSCFNPKIRQTVDRGRGSDGISFSTWEGLLRFLPKRGRDGIIARSCDRTLFATE